MTIAGSVVGCTEKKISAQDGPIRVQIPSLSDKTYSMQEVELLTITDLSRLEGTAAQFFMEPTSQDGEIVGKAPAVRFMKSKEGVYVAMDALSLQLVTLYYQFERLMFLDQQIGVATVNIWPRKVAINARFSSEDGSLLQNNALYSSAVDTYLFVPFTSEDLPLMVNSGVIGHEHFHSIFNQIVMRPLGDRYPKSDLEDLYLPILLRGLNEGMADVWGWIFSKDSNFVGRSLPSEKLSRRLDFDVLSMPTRKELSSLIAHVPPEYEVSISYKLGNKLARSIYGLSKVMLNQPGMTEDKVRIEMGKALVLTLSELRTFLDQKKPEDVMAPAQILFWFYKSLSLTTTAECEYFQNMVKDPDLVTAFSCKK